MTDKPETEKTEEKKPLVHAPVMSKAQIRAQRNATRRSMMVGQKNRADRLLKKF